jgi:hypothetical protein
VAASKVTQPNSMESTEEEPVLLSCNHSTIATGDYIYWYRQIPLQGPEYIIHGLKSNVTNRMFSLAIHDDRKSSTLILPHASLRDTGVYYCIVRDTHWDSCVCTCAVSPWWGKGSWGSNVLRTLHRMSRSSIGEEVQEKEKR